jgi:hypothetical protein
MDIASLLTQTDDRDSNRSKSEYQNDEMDGDASHRAMIQGASSYVAARSYLSTISDEDNTERSRSKISARVSTRMLSLELSPLEKRRQVIRPSSARMVRLESISQVSLARFGRIANQC